MMNKGTNLIELWKKKGQIWEGIKNSVFKREDAEAIADNRLAICRSNACGYHDPEGSSPAAIMKGAESCASCGCKLSWKTRALSDSCPEGSWKAVLTQTEEALMREKLGIGEEE